MPHILICLLSATLSRAASSDLHVYRHSLAQLGGVSSGPLPTNYSVERLAKEGIATLKPSRWRPATKFRLEFDGIIREKLKLSPWRVNEALVVDVAGERRVFLELRETVFLTDRFRLVEMKLEGTDRPFRFVERIRLVPLAFEMEVLRREGIPFRSFTAGPEWARRAVLEVDNEASASRLIQLMVPEPSDDPRILLIPADHVGHQRLETLMNKNAMTLELPPTSRRCVGHLTVVK